MKIKLELHSYSEMQGLESHKDNDGVNKQNIVGIKKRRMTVGHEIHFSKIRNVISLAKRPLSDQTTNFREINSLCTISHTYLLCTQKHVNGIMFTGFTKNSIIKYIGCTIVVGINCSNNLKDICHKRCMVCVVGINYNNKLKDM